MESITGLFGSLWPAFTAGLSAGLLIAFPFGPLGQLAARLTAEKKRRAAREIAFTCVAVDALMSACILLIINSLPPVRMADHPVILGGIGVVLILLGLELWRSAPNAAPGQLPGGFKHPWKFAATYSIFHPGSLLAFMAAFGVMHAQGIFAQGPADKIICWVGTVLGTFGCWAAWIALIHHLKRSCNPGLLRLIFARGLALAFVGSGVTLIWKSQAYQHIWNAAEHVSSMAFRFASAMV